MIPECSTHRVRMVRAHLDDAEFYQCPVADCPQKRPYKRRAPARPLRGGMKPGWARDVLGDELADALVRDAYRDARKGLQHK